MNRINPLWRCLLVLSLLAPLVFLEGGPYTPPDWFFNRWQGVPLTAIVGVVLLLAFVILTAIYGARQTDRT